MTGELELSAPAGKPPLRCRLTIGRAGDAEVTTAPLPPAPQAWRVVIAAERLDPGAARLRHKTTERGLYDHARANLPAGVDEAIFLNTRGELAEGTITNLFVRRGAALLTPPLASGCLPGILRAELLASGRAREEVLEPGALRDAALLVGNALRGLIPAVLVGSRPTTDLR